MSNQTLGFAAGAVSAAAAEVGPNQATSHQLACLGRRPTESLSEQAVAVPIAAVAAHHEPPLLPPQRPEHKVGFAPFLDKAALLPALACHWLWPISLSDCVQA